MLEIVKAELDRLRGRVGEPTGSTDLCRAGSLTDSPGRCTKGSYWTPYWHKRWDHCARPCPSFRLIRYQGRPLNMIVHLNVPDSVIMARIAGESPPGY
jgi:hypothetical protein